MTFLSDYNTLVNNATRLAEFRAALVATLLGGTPGAYKVRVHGPCCAAQCTRLLANADATGTHCNVGSVDDPADGVPR